MDHALTARYGDLVSGSYDCVDRIVLNAYFSMGYSPGGFRTWWRRLHGSDEHLDNTHLMRMAGRFARRVRGWAKAHGVPVIDTKAGERKHRIAEEYLADHIVDVGVFMVLVARAPATVWKVTQSRSGVIVNLEKKTEYVNHYSFHIRDPVWGHVTIKMSGHPPFGAQIMLNGHEYVAVAARAAGIDFVKDGNCFTALSEPERLTEIADTVSQPGAAGLLRQVCDRWIYSACVCFGLDFDEQLRSSSATATRSTNSSTAATCCSPTGHGCNGSSMPSSIGPGHASTCHWCAPCSEPEPAPTSTATAVRLDSKP